VDVRIGVINTPKEITVELADDTDVDRLVADVESTVSSAGAVLWLTDVRGRRVGVPAERIAYVDVGAEGGTNPVGFG
jgi:5-carboxymethyl-2-hydroxymuconate isomerase